MCFLLINLPFPSISWRLQELERATYHKKCVYTMFDKHWNPVWRDDSRFSFHGIGYVCFIGCMKFMVRAGQSTGFKSDSTFSKATLTPFWLRLWPPYLSIAGIQWLRSLLVRSMPLRGQVFYHRYCIGCTGLCSMTLHRNSALSVIPVIIKMLKI